MSEMSELEIEFNKAVQRKPGNEVLLELYSLYKQATIGPVNIPQPWAIQMVERAKWDAWKKQETLSKSQAMSKYIELINRLFV